MHRHIHTAPTGETAGEPVNQPTDDVSTGALADEPTGKSEKETASEPRVESTLASTICLSTTDEPTCDGTVRKPIGQMHPGHLMGNRLYQTPRWHHIPRKKPLKCVGCHYATNSPAPTLWPSCRTNNWEYPIWGRLWHVLNGVTTTIISDIKELISRVGVRAPQ
jgi:hypothetical protein